MLAMTLITEDKFVAKRMAAHGGPEWEEEGGKTLSTSCYNTNLLSNSYF